MDRLFSRGRHEPPPARQRLAVPAYFIPGGDWDQLLAAAPAVGLAILNPGSGPGAVASAAYAAQVRHAQAAGVRILGYVHTRYGTRGLAAVRGELDAYVAWYGVDGFFIDEASADQGALPYYRALHAAIKASDGDRLVMLNPGTAMDEEYMHAADIVVTFEGSYGTYARHYLEPAWAGGYPASRFCHLVYDVGTTRRVRRVLALSRRRNVGWVYATSGVLPNPWGGLPEAAAWRAQLGAVQVSDD